LDSEFLLLKKSKLPEILFVHVFFFRFGGVEVGGVEHAKSFKSSEKFRDLTFFGQDFPEISKFGQDFAILSGSDLGFFKLPQPPPELGQDFLVRISWTLKTWTPNETPNKGRPLTGVSFERCRVAARAFNF